MIQGVKEYEKRLKGYTNLEIVEFKDEPLPQKMTEEEVGKIKRKEEERIKKHLDRGDFKIILDSKGVQYSSEEFAGQIDKYGKEGISKLNFIIGGTLGFSKDFRRQGDLLLSFSKMIFPHQLMRLLFLEQLYRAFKINKGEPYHR